MHTFIRVRPMPDAPSFVHFSWLDDRPPTVVVPARRPFAARVAGWLRRAVRRLFDRGDAPWT